MRKGVTEMPKYTRSAKQTTHSALVNVSRRGTKLPKPSVVKAANALMIMSRMAKPARTTKPAQKRTIRRKRTV